jgi:hypothetical protein
MFIKDLMTKKTVNIESSIGLALLTEKHALTAS